MANTLLAPAIIAQESLMQLENNLVLGGLVNRNYSSEFVGGVGDTITIRKPNTFKVDEFDGTIKTQDVTESGVPVKMDRLLDITFSVTSRDLAQNITDFGEQFIAPAMSAFAQSIDSRLAQLALDVPYFTGTAGTPPSTVSAITSVRKVMNDNKVPAVGRKLVIDTAADAKLLELDAFNRVDATGTNLAIQEAILGRKFGYDVYFDQNIVMHENGDIAGSAIKLSVAANPGDTTMVLTDTTLTGTIKKGTLFTVAGSNQQFVVTKDATAVSNAVTVDVYPAVSDGIAMNSAVTLVDNHSCNIAFHRDAFAMVSRPLAKPMGNTNVATISSNGIGLRVNMSYDWNTKSDVISIDGLFGFATLNPELACRLLG